MLADMFRGSGCDKSELPGAWVEFTAFYPTTIPEVTCLHHGVKKNTIMGTPLFQLTLSLQVKSSLCSKFTLHYPSTQSSRKTLV